MFLILKHELLLTAVAISVLMAELFRKTPSSKGIQKFALLLFFIHTILCFSPVRSETLFGGMFVNSQSMQFVKNILNLGTLIVLLQAHKWLQRKENEHKIGEFYVVLFSTLLGLYFMTSAGNFLMLYLGLELSSLPLATLTAYEQKKRESAEAGVKFVFLSALSSGVLLYGLSMIYTATGSMYFDTVQAGVTTEPILMLGLIFFLAGMAFKLSLVPFHLWTADVYQGAPTSITSYLSVVSKGAAAYTAAIVLVTVFGGIMELWRPMIYLLTVATITIGNLFALRQQNLKRFFAFSSISQAGFLLLGIISGQQLGLTAVVYYVLVYVVSNLAVFAVIASIENQTGKLTINDYNGLYHTNPKLTLLMTLGLFSLAGIPPVAGFFGKFFLFTAAAQEGFYILVLIAVINTIISLYYYLLIVKAMFINPNEQPIEHFVSDRPARLGMVICLVGMALIGFYSDIFTTIFKIFS